MEKKITVEVCCGSVNDCILAKKYGADRIELNHALELGGMTPSLGTLIEAKRLVDLPICCMVRPRKSGFDYSEEQFQVMLKDAELFMNHGADGVVFGFLHADGTINAKRTKVMAQLASSHNKEAIFHKAFDSTEDLEESLKVLIECGVTRVLTSGGSVYPNILEGCKELAYLIEKYGDKIQILPGGGVREHNTKQILAITHSNQIHLTAKCELTDESTSHFRTGEVGSTLTYIATGEVNLEKIMVQIRTFDPNSTDSQIVTLQAD